MKAKVVLDASALIAVLNEEPGSEVVKQHLSKAMISAVNLSETLAVLLDIGVPQTKIQSIIPHLIKTVVPFNQTHAYITAQLRAVTKPYGLSLGDRACLALAKLEKCIVLTADKIWSQLDCGVEIKLIR